MNAADDAILDGIENDGLPVRYSDSLGLDSFGRLRTSAPFTIFDSKQIHSDQPLFWDDQETSGSGTSSTHSTATASTTMAVSADTAGTRVRQTFQRFNYQPGKSQLVLMTANISQLVEGVTTRVGYFDDNNGLFFEADGTSLYVVRRTKTSGSVVDNAVSSASWNVDKMDGSGKSGVAIDPTKTQILFIDFEWLGVGRVRMGFVVNGQYHVCHEFRNANTLSVVYMSTPNLPLRYEISNDGTGPAASLMHICGTVISEGGRNRNGVLRHTDSGSVASLQSGSTYALLGIRLKSTNVDAMVELESLSLLASVANNSAHWELLFNPTVSGTFTYSDVSDSTVQVAVGTVSNTVTSSGTEIDGGYFSTAFPPTPTTPNALRLGSAIDGTVDEIIVAVKPVTNNITVQASLTWRELS